MTPTIPPVADDEAMRIESSDACEPHDDHDDSDIGCANCGGEGFTYSCSWDWQCDTYDEGEGTCLCTRPCDWCSPRKPDAVLQEVLRGALQNGGTGDGQ